MAEIDPHDRLLEACRNADQYPYTLLKNTISRAILKNYYTYLSQNEAALLDGPNHRIIFWELWLGEQSTYQPNPDLCLYGFAKSNT